MCSESTSALQVARYIIGALPVDNLKLQKLLYYSQAVHLVRTGNVLFSDEIQAWRYGPVVPNVYHMYKTSGFETIVDPDSEDELDLSNNQLRSIDMVLAYYGEMSSIRLVNETHTEDPWKNVFKENEMGITITVESMLNYYRDVLEISEGNEE